MSEVILRIYKSDQILVKKLPDLKIIHTEKNKTTFSFTVNSNLLNSSGTLHAGEISYIADYLTTFVLAQEAKPLGVSTEIHTTYMAPAVLGDEIEADNQIDRVGKTLAYLSVRFYKKTEKERKLIAVATHSKALPKQ